ncbi:type II toxin-antitoxin system YafO family toxin [Kingella negevensis]|uniref:type II toxin-antitoxin system YafO family toxin n=1 Tax=Kingella negevensis TaxID=1522312 RepID=UPI00254F7488|nr:type II toxin-antitoxin system YafO family toxin [Kingella negevensis]MDK4681094.1 type II toxin-antitoxin system YafO family toxin [Kingella negevensis]MDK4683296.1 type II toxin-antitoxin system YafO family toxin [Kingella negevensis]MDK4691572.1 type II toxin-antitoxin system YafO family toxin [Kingella negevensis]MDK4693277.1 type II toxin-antitoxin system YafO family toxin [Kingella negevensis]MDK4699577.1 type II toxin-antitoxin system YafO family toxin [Kingella negevensis]
MTKSTTVAGEFNHYEFSKDGAYIMLKVNGESYILRHVHLVPVINLQDKMRWDRAWQMGRKRTSDRALIYVADGDSHLLIAILDEPTAHQIAKMEMPTDRAIMEQFAQIADKFVYYREIIA